MLFVAATAVWCGDLAREGLTKSVPVVHAPDIPSSGEVRRLNDQRLLVYLVSRNARTLATRPGRLFDARHCFPARQSLAYSEGAIALGVVGVPFELLVGDPVAVFNLVLLSITLIAAFSMYFLVRAWTGVPAAGVIAGMAYAFHAGKAAGVVHPYVHDTGWTVLALLFATRLVEKGRWRDAALLGLCASMQVAGSLYPLIGAVTLASPIALALILHHRARAIRTAQWVPVAILVVLVAWTVLAPTSAQTLGT